MYKQIAGVKDLVAADLFGLYLHEFSFSMTQLGAGEACMQPSRACPALTLPFAGRQTDFATLT